MGVISVSEVIGQHHQVAVKKVIARTHVTSRRQLRKSRLYLYFDDGSKTGFDTNVQLGHDPTAITVRNQRFFARFGPAPLAWLDKPTDTITGRDPRRNAEQVLRYGLPIGDVEPVGRLDKDTEGLLLFTGDGQLLHGLIRTSSAIERVYLAKSAGTPDPKILAAYQQGAFKLHDGFSPVAEVVPAVSDDLGAYELEGDGWWQITLRSGKYHEVRRLMAAAGAKVDRLVRVRFGPISLPQGPVGTGRAERLSKDAIVALYEAAGVTPGPILEVYPAGSSAAAELPPAAKKPAGADEPGDDDTTESTG